MSAGGAIRAGRAFVEAFLDDTRLQRGLRRTQARLRAFGGTVQRIGKAFIVPAAVGGALFGLTAVVFANFEKNLALAAARVRATETEFESLRKKARELGETTQFSASQAASAMAIFAQSGFDVAEILDIIGPTLNLAAAGQIDIAEAADVASKALKGMTIETSRLGEVVDTLAAASLAANTDILAIGEALKFVGPVAKSSGLGISDLTAGIIALQDAAFEGGQAGTLLRGVMLALISPTGDAAKALKDMNIDIDDGSGKMRKFSEIVGQFEKELSGLEPLAKLELLARIFPSKTVAGFAALLGRGSDSIAELEKKVTQSGEAARLAAAGLDTLSGQFQILLSALESVGISIGNAILKPVRLAIETVAGLLSTIAQWVEMNQGLIRSIFLSVVAAAGLGVGLTVLGTALKIAAGLLGAIATTIGLLVSAFGFLITPIGLASAAIVALVVTLVDFKGVASSAVDFVVDVFKNLVDRVGESVAAIRKALVSGDIKTAGKILFATLKAEFRRAIVILNDIWQDWKFFFLETLASAKATALLTFGSLLTEANSVFDKLGEIINEFIGTTGRGLVAWFKAFDNGLRIIGIGIDETGETLKELGRGLRIVAEPGRDASPQEDAKEKARKAEEARIKDQERAEKRAAREDRDKSKRETREALEIAEEKAADVIAGNEFLTIENLLEEQNRIIENREGIGLGDLIKILRIGELIEAAETDPEFLKVLTQAFDLQREKRGAIDDIVDFAFAPPPITQEERKFEALPERIKKRIRQEEKAEKDREFLAIRAARSAKERARLEELGRQAQANLQAALASIDADILAAANKRVQKRGGVIEVDQLIARQRLRDSRKQRRLDLSPADEARNLLKEQAKAERERRKQAFEARRGGPDAEAASKAAMEGFDVAADVFGSFSAFALRGATAGATGAADRTAKATEESAKLLGSMAAKAQPLVFKG